MRITSAIGTFNFEDSANLGSVKFVRDTVLSHIMLDVPGRDRRIQTTLIGRGFEGIFSTGDRRSLKFTLDPIEDKRIERSVNSYRASHALPASDHNYEGETYV